MRCLLLFFNVSLICVSLSGQNGDNDLLPSIESGVDNHEIIYTKYASGGLSYLTHGYQASFRRQHTRSAFYEHGYEIDLSLIRHPKEVNVRSGVYLGGMPYCYGKINTHINLRAGYGLNKEIADRVDMGAVEINAYVASGLSLALLKPVYLYVADDDGIVKRRYDPDKYPQSSIMGGTWFFNGLDRINFHPGVYLKAGINFDYSMREARILTLEIGAVIDYYFTDVKIMKAPAKNYSLYNAFYISMFFGKKWN